MLRDKYRHRQAARRDLRLEKSCAKISAAPALSISMPEMQFSLRCGIAVLPRCVKPRSPFATRCWASETMSRTLCDSVCVEACFCACGIAAGLRGKSFPNECRNAVVLALDSQECGTSECCQPPAPLLEADFPLLSGCGCSLLISDSPAFGLGTASSFFRSEQVDRQDGSYRGSNSVFRSCGLLTGVAEKTGSAERTNSAAMRRGFWFSARERVFVVVCFSPLLLLYLLLVEEEEEEDSLLFIYTTTSIAEKHFSRARPVVRKRTTKVRKRTTENSLFIRCHFVR
jgi:hypothetical protein